MRGFTVQPQTIAVGHYVGVLAPGSAPLRDSIDQILRGAMRDGTLERIFRKWNVWSDDQPKLYDRVLAGQPVAPFVVSGGIDPSGVGTTSAATMTSWEAARRYFPSLIRASGVTIALSCLSMGLAVVVGIMIATGRVYGGRVVRALLL